MSYKQKEIIGNATLYLGDGYEIAPQLGIMDAVVTDPPYEFDTSGGGKYRKARKCFEDIVAAGLDQGFDHSILNTMLYKAVVVFCHNDQLPELLGFLQGSFHRFCVMSYHKTNPQPFANKHYAPDTEFFIHAWNEGGHPVGTFHDKKRYIIGQNGKSEFDHPTVKPLDVMDKIIRNINGNRILDPFMGTGSTGIAAVKQGIEFFGIEHNEKYFDIACTRLEAAMRGREVAA
jgi:DNA modification methylase